MTRIARTPDHGLSGLRQRRVAAVAVVGIWMLGGATTGLAASPDPTGTPFASTLYPYTIVLPPGWSGTPLMPGSPSDVFEGPGANADVNSRGAAPEGQTVQQRVDLRRAEVVAEGCTSDPADDVAGTLGGEFAIAWTRICDATVHVTLATIHDGAGYALTVHAPVSSADEAPGMVDQLASTFVFTAAETASPAPSADLAAIDASLQGTWRTEWAPTELWLASVVAAGLDPRDGDVGWTSHVAQTERLRNTIRFEDGRLALYEAVDGGSDELEWQGSYRLLDEDTIEAVETSSFDTIVYDFVLRGDVLTMDVISDAGGVSGMVPQTSIFETLPFTRVP